MTKAKSESEPGVLLQLLTKLTGVSAPFARAAVEGAARGEDVLARSGMGYSQLNEVLLSLGYPRVSEWFFQYLVDGTTNYKVHNAFQALSDLETGVERFRKHAMLSHGNVRYAFEYLRTRSQIELQQAIDLHAPISDQHYTQRHEPIHPINAITGEDTYYLGYLVKAEMDRLSVNNPNDKSIQQQIKRREQIVEQGIANHRAYLASDHMDVYVATSMRERHEYYFVNVVARKIFEQPELCRLKARWFDPTQAYCFDRIDKGIAEALMLKRAKCTLYFAQESDTLGKDSELASTLAQGKVVVAFVPDVKRSGKSKYVKWLLKSLGDLYPGKTEMELVLQQLQVFAPGLAWTDGDVKKWLSNPSTYDAKAAQARLAEIVAKHYDSRAELLMRTHPLAIQVNLDTGVANGVLVARTTQQCAQIIRGVLLNALEFDVEECEIEDRTYLLLRERISGSVFRVVSGDAELTNSFWNFYLS